MRHVTGLERYYRILSGKSRPRYLICKKIPVEFGEKDSEQALWGKHAKAMEVFRATVEASDTDERGSGNIRPKKSLLDLKVELAFRSLEGCWFCERVCGVNRKVGEKGFCQAGTGWKIFGTHLHYGEEDELVPSGTIFQAACSMRCVYCQNAPEAVTPGLGQAWSADRAAAWIRHAKAMGAVNVNWVGGSPTPWLWHILNVLSKTEVPLPMVWNSNAYYSEKTARLLDGVMDVYLLDFRYFSDRCAVRLSSAPGYPEAAKRNHIFAKGCGELLVRLLVLPGHLECDAKPTLKWIRENTGPETRLNILAQYRPCWMAAKFREIGRPLTEEEHREVEAYAARLGLRNIVAPLYNLPFKA